MQGHVGARAEAPGRRGPTRHQAALHGRGRWRDATRRVRVGGVDRAALGRLRPPPLRAGTAEAIAHRPGLSRVPLPHLRQAVQRTLRHAAEPGTLPVRRHRPRGAVEVHHEPPLRASPEMFAVRGSAFRHEAVCESKPKLAPAPRTCGGAVAARRAEAGWSMKLTSRSAGAGRCYIYRAIDGSGAPVDAMSSDKRDVTVTRALFGSAEAAAGVGPDRVTTDGHSGHPGAIRTEPGRKVRHRTGTRSNDGPEQDHRGLKGRSRSMRGFGCPGSAVRFCRAYDEPRDFLLRRTTTVPAILEAARAALEARPRQESCVPARAPTQPAFRRSPGGPQRACPSKDAPGLSATRPSRNAIGAASKARNSL